MKTLQRFTLTALISVFATGAAAGDSDRDNYQRCKVDVQAVLGAETHTRLYDIHNRRSGDRFRIKAYPVAGEALALNCWVADDGTVTLETRNGIALRPQARESLKQVTLNR